MRIIEISGENRERKYKKKYEGCRGILIRDGKILLSYYKRIDQYLIPGGGLEMGESLRECCVRELCEEVGIEVDPHTHYLTLEEYYHDNYFKSHYFLCDYISECERSLTQNEIKEGLEPRWVDFDEYKGTNEIRYGAYYREYLALKEIQIL